MKNIKFDRNFIYYLLSIVTMSVLMTNFDIFISYNYETSLFILVASIPIYFIFHLHYYKFFKGLLEDKTCKITKAIFLSSLVGIILMVLLSLFNFIYVNNTKFSINKNNILTDISLAIIILIGLICAIVLAIFSYVSKKKHAFKILFQSIAFYVLLFVLTQILFAFLGIFTGAFG